LVLNNIPAAEALQDLLTELPPLSIQLPDRGSRQTLTPHRADFISTAAYYRINTNSRYLGNGQILLSTNPSSVSILALTLSKYGFTWSAAAHSLKRLQRGIRSGYR